LIKPFFILNGFSDLFFLLNWGMENQSGTGFDQVLGINYSVPLFDNEGLGEILLDKSPSALFFKGGGERLLIGR